jgi:predicted P-loop ATPase
MCNLPCNKHVFKQSDMQRAVERAIKNSFTPLARLANWREVKANGRPVPSFHNARVSITALGIECRYDLFHDRIIIGFRCGQIHHVLAGEFTDKALIRLRQFISDRFGFDPRTENVLDAVKSLALENCFDPVLDMLDMAQAAWDQTQRLDTWVITYFKCEDTPLNRAIGRLVLIEAVRRARRPGCKFDNITVLESGEGLLKSTAICVLAGDENFSDQSALGVRDKEVQEILTGVWMHENADLAGMKKAEVEHVKAFASRQVDRARPAYGRLPEWRPRRAIEWGTTNNSQYLLSQTGNRRFWPLAVGKIDIDALRRDRLQLLGEAATHEAKDESLVLDESLWSAAGEAQEQRRVTDPWEDKLSNIPKSVNVLDGRWQQIIHNENVGDGHQRQKVASQDLLTYVLQIPTHLQTAAHGVRLALAMKKVGWQRANTGKVTINGIGVRGYWRDQSAPFGLDDEADPERPGIPF